MMCRSLQKGNDMRVITWSMAAVVSLFACGGSSSSGKTTPAGDGDLCDSVHGMLKRCWDRSGAYNDCEEAALHASGVRSEFSEDKRAMAGTLCRDSCRAVKRGASWESYKTQVACSAQKTPSGGINLSLNLSEK